MVRRVLRLVSSEAKRREVALNVELAYDVPHVHCDLIQIEQVLLNLMLNAFDAVSDRPDEQRTIVVRTKELPSPAVEFSIADSGRGLPAGEEHKIFDAFFTTKLEGIGLGLAISRTIVEAHGGQLQAVANPSGGTIMFFSLPATTHRRSDS
jgi:signal transduction histidine kinase